VWKALFPCFVFWFGRPKSIDKMSGQEYLTHRFVPCEFLHDFVIIMQRPVDVKLVSETVSKRQSMSALMVDY